MGFWGVEVKPDKPHPFHSADAQGTLYVTQATLGLGSSKERVILQCSLGYNSPVFLCSLLPGKTESCSLHLEFVDQLVAFSVIGKRSIHLSGYFLSEEGDALPDDYEWVSAEDISDTESDESSESDYDDEDDLNMFPSSAAPKPGVVIEEIEEDDKPANQDGFSKAKKKKSRADGSAGNKENDQKLESEDEDGFPVSETEVETYSVQVPEPEIDGRIDKSKESKKKKNKRKVDTNGPEDSQPEKKKKLKQKAKKEPVAEMDEDNQKEISGDETKRADTEEGSPDINESEPRETDADAGNVPPQKKKKNKKKKKANVDGENTIVAVLEKSDEGRISSLVSNEKQSTSKSSKVRTFTNGLVVEELAMGKPDGKRASPGNKVSVSFTGKLQKNGEIFKSNVGKAPFEFRLGVGQVIKGWDVGVNGMRVGDKRRITVPPAMGYGDEGAGSKIPPDSWVVFEIELVNVC